MEPRTYLSPEELLSFDDVCEQVEKRADLNLPDQTLDMRVLKFTPEGRIYVPNAGMMKLTDWSQRQLASLVGINWDRWFCKEKDKDSGSVTYHISKKEAQAELMRRFDRIPRRCLIRTRKHPKARADSDGIVRGILTETYRTIDDRRILDRARVAWRDQLDEIRFLNGAGRTAETDRSSHYSVIIGDPVKVKTGGNDPHLGDFMHCGFKMRNSEVGSCALTADEFWLRLICLNGLMSMVGNNRLMYRQHRNISDEDLDGSLIGMFQALPERLATQKTQWEKVMGIRYEDHEEAKKVLQRFLHQRQFSKKIVEAALGSYDMSTHGTDDGSGGEATGYWVLNAITNAARDMKADDRHDLELAGGKFLMAQAA